MQEKICQHCKISFVPNNARQIYCKKSHKQRAVEKRALAGIVTVSNNLNDTVPATVPVKMDAVSAFIIDQLKRERDSLTAKIAKLETSNENLLAEKNDLKEQNKELQGSLEEKPKGLAGFAKENPDLIKEGIGMALPLLAGWIEKMSSKPQGALGEVVHENQLVTQIKNQSLEIQNGITQLVHSIVQSPKAMEYLNYFNSSFLRQQNSR